MQTIVEDTRIAGDTCDRLKALDTRLRGWNLVSGLCSGQRRRPEEDLVHALAAEARQLVVRSFRLACRLGETSLGGSGKRSRARIERQLDELAERELYLAKQCRAALKEPGSKRTKR